MIRARAAAHNEFVTKRRDPSTDNYATSETRKIKRTIHLNNATDVPPCLRKKTPTTDKNMAGEW
jgi:hypothetical protein